MLFANRPRKIKKLGALTEIHWHDHFAWWPTTVGDHTAWLHTIQRRWIVPVDWADDTGFWEYRLKGRSK